MIASGDPPRHIGRPLCSMELAGPSFVTVRRSCGSPWRSVDVGAARRVEAAKGSAERGRCPRSADVCCRSHSALQDKNTPSSGSLHRKRAMTKVDATTVRPRRLLHWVAIADMQRPPSPSDCSLTKPSCTQRQSLKQPPTLPLVKQSQLQSQHIGKLCPPLSLTPMPNFSSAPATGAMDITPNDQIRPKRQTKPRIVDWASALEPGPSFPHRSPPLRLPSVVVGGRVWHGGAWQRSASKRPPARLNPGYHNRRGTGV